MKNNLFVRMSLVAMTLCFGLATSAANAITEVTLNGNNDAGYAGVFGGVVNGAFNNTFSFMMPVGASGNGGSNTISLDYNNSFSFSSFNLYSAYDKLTGVLSGLLSTGSISSAAVPGVGTYDVAALSFSNLAAPATYFLNVVGYTATRATSASYSGNINISPVPEPEMYAMMLVGLGLLGFSARRRNLNS